MIAGLAWALVAGVSLLACNDLSEEECLKIRGEAYDIVNDQQRDNPHTCADDTDCHPTEWPGCAMPVNTKNKEKIDALKEKFDKGSCKEPESECPETPLMYCKQGLCVKKHEAGEAGKTTN